MYVCAIRSFSRVYLLTCDKDVLLRSATSRGTTQDIRARRHDGVSRLPSSRRVLLLPTLLEHVCLVSFTFMISRSTHRTFYSTNTTCQTPLVSVLACAQRPTRSLTCPNPDRVFAHALNTVKKLPRLGTLRPPPEARLLLYGLYKQSMGTPSPHNFLSTATRLTLFGGKRIEGDITGIMDRPQGDSEAERAEQDKW